MYTKGAGFWRCHLLGSLGWASVQRQPLRTAGLTPRALRSLNMRVPTGNAQEGAPRRELCPDLAAPARLRDESTADWTPRTEDVGQCCLCWAVAQGNAEHRGMRSIRIKPASIKKGFSSYISELGAEALVWNKHCHFCYPSSCLNYIDNLPKVADFE